MSDQDGADQPRAVVELAQQQLRGIAAWTASRHEVERALEAGARGREAAADARRRLEGLRRQHRALVERADQQLRESVDLLRVTVPVRAVLAHRNAWFRDKVAACLAEHGIRVVCAVDDGADAVGVAVAEQPDLVLVEDALPTVRGEDVVRELSRLSPRSTLVGLVGYDDGIAAMLDAGAAAAYVRRMPPGDVGLAAAALLGADLSAELRVAGDLRG